MADWDIKHLSAASVKLPHFITSVKYFNCLNNKKTSSRCCLYDADPYSILSRISSRIFTESSIHPWQLLIIVPVVIPFNSLHTVL